MNRLSFGIVFCTAIVSMLLFSCKSEPQEIVVKSVTLSTQTLELITGSSTSLEVTVEPAKAADKTLVWTSSDAEVATVSEEGLVRAVAPGRSVITATAVTGSKDRCVVTVKNAFVHVSGLSLSKENLNLHIGDTEELIATVSPENADDKSLSWTSSRPDVLSVSERGVVKALASGVATVRVATNDSAEADGRIIIASCNVLVLDESAASILAPTNVSALNAVLNGSAALPQFTPRDSVRTGFLLSPSPQCLPGTSVWLNAAANSDPASFSVRTGTLIPDTKYYYKSYLQIGEADFTFSQVGSFTTLPVSSFIETVEASAVKTRSAVLSANLDLDNCFYDSIRYGFKLFLPGQSAPAITVSGFSAPETKKYSHTQDNLPIDSDCEFCAFVELDGVSYEAEKKSFHTDTLAAVLSVDDAGSIGLNGATVCGKLEISSEGTFAISAKLYYAKGEKSLAELRSSGTAVQLSVGADGRFSTGLSGLDVRTLYSYAAVADVEGYEFVSGVKSFSTRGYSVSVGAEITESNITMTSAPITVSYVQNDPFTVNSGTGWYYYSAEESSIDGLVGRGTKGKCTTYLTNAFGGTISELTPGTTYYLLPAVILNDVEYLGSTVLSFTTLSEGGGGAVDLGLSVRWGSANIMADNPEDSGGYFAWGETDSKTYFGFNNYRFGTYDAITKYPANPSGTSDLLTLEAEDDAASVLLENGWRIPTAAEWQELLDNCTFTSTSDYNGAAGYLVTSNKEGYTEKSIFLPAAGLYKCTNVNGASVITSAGQICYYWTADVYSSGINNANVFLGNANTKIIGPTYRACGLPIRAVKP